MAGKIATAAQTIAVEKKQAVTPMQTLKGILDGESMKKRLAETMAEGAGAFSASIIELFASDSKLRECDPMLVVQECLKAASLKLPINKQLGFAYVLPYKGKPSFQLGYKGIIQLAQRSGAYKYINADVVYEGELAAIDKLTGNIDLSGEKVSNKVIGYFSYIELVNGFRKTVYMSKDDVVAHAKKYSKQYYNGSFSGTWANDFDAMALKTVLKRIISKYGVMSVDMAQAVVSEYDADTLNAPVVEDIATDEMNDANIPDVDDNGEVISGEIVIE